MATKAKTQTTKKMNAFYAQSGGVTSVINASACGVIETARKHKDKIGKVYAGRNGIIGALTEDLIDTSKESASSIATCTNSLVAANGTGGNITTINTTSINCNSNRFGCAIATCARFFKQIIDKVIYL